jgi:hypothetical protein
MAITAGTFEHCYIDIPLQVLRQSSRASFIGATRDRRDADMDAAPTCRAPLHKARSNRKCHPNENQRLRFTSFISCAVSGLADSREGSLLWAGCVARRPGTATALQAHSHRRTASARATRPARALHQDGCCTTTRGCAHAHTGPNSLSAPMLAPRCRVPAASSSTACTSTSASRSGKTVRL